MFEREVMIAGLRKQQVTLRELIEELEDKPRLRGPDLLYAEGVMKKIESTLKKLRRPVMEREKYFA